LKKKIFLAIISIGIIVTWWHNVPKKVTKSDISYINKLIPELKAKKSDLFDEQIKDISLAQQNILEYTDADSIFVGIDYSQKREPKNLFEEKHGLCYDRSRTLEKTFLMMGYKIRHVSLYDKLDNLKLLKTIVTPQIPSHAILEVKTKKGWMIVDTNNPWLGLDSDNNPVSFKQLPLKNNTWKTPPYKGYEVFYIEPSYHIYGLYSRHGKFYPPFTPIPDYNLRELLYNF